MIYEVVSDLASVEIDNERYVYCDTETIGLYGEIRLVQIFQSHWDKVKIFDTRQTPLQDIFNLLQDKQLVFHNGCYDIMCFMKNLGLSKNPFNTWEDTFLSGRLQYPELESFSLDSMLLKALGFDPYFKNGIVKSEMQKSNFSKDLSEQQLLYGAIDVYYMPHLMQEVIVQIDSPSYEVDKLSVENLLVCSLVGIPVNKEILENERVLTQEDISAFVTKYPDLNPNSPKQVKERLGTESSEDKTLADLASQGVELAKDVRLWRKALKKMNFIEKFDKPRVYGHFNIATRSGRSNCSEENLQQIPSSLKHLFQTDKFFVYADFSNLELRTFCAMVGERVMERMFREDIDLHTFSAHRLFNVPMEEVAKLQRQIAKTFNFSSLYGAGVEKRLMILLANTGIKLSYDVGVRLANEWNRAYPAVKPWQEHNAKMWRAGAKGYTALGRPYIANLYTDFGNLQIQGSGAEVAKLALHYLSKELDISKLCAFIHDSYTFEVDTLEEAKHYAEVLAHSMQNAWFEVAENFKIKDLPMPVTAGVGKNWKKLQADEDLIHSYTI